MTDWASAPETSLPQAPQTPDATDWTAAPPVDSTPQTKAVVGAMGNPDEAGKAVGIAARTGIPAPVVQTDLPGYTAHAATQDAVKAVQNPHIASYVDGHPMAAKVSADDYNKLDDISKLIQAISPHEINSESNRQVVNSIPELVEALSTAPGRAKLGSALYNLPFTAAGDVVDVLRAGTEAATAELMHGATRRASGVPLGSFTDSFMNQVYDLGHVGAGLFGWATSPFLPTFGLAKTFLARPLAIAENIPLEQATSDVGTALLGMRPTLGGARGVPPAEPPNSNFENFMSAARGAKTRAEMDDFLRKRAEETNGDVGKQLQITQAKTASEGLDAVVKAAQDSKTKQRSPQMFEDFAAQHDDPNLHINAQTALDLYKKEGKTPAEGDGLLGFIPGLADQLETASGTGGEITTPLSKYVANIDPTVHEALKDNIRLHDDGTTLAEAEELKKTVDVSEMNAPLVRTLADHFPEMFGEKDTGVLPDDTAGQVTDANAPAAEGTNVQATPGVNASRLAKLLGPKLYGEPTNMATVSVKEMMQNAFDAVKGHLEKGIITKGKIHITTDEQSRTITVSDNGSGMTPEVLGKQFLEIAGTNKETQQASGGLGIAKMLFLFGNKNLAVRTVRDGKVSTMQTTGEDLFAALNDPSRAPSINIRNATPEELASHPHGTTVSVQVPEQFKDPSSGEMRSIDFPSSSWKHPVLVKSPLFHNIEVRHSRDIDNHTDGDPLPIGAHFPHKDYTQFANMNFDWGTAHVYVSKEPVKAYSENNVEVLSNGLWQFDTAIKKNPQEAYGDSIDRKFIIDIAPRVSPEEAGYPFDLNRQQFVNQTKKDFGNFFNYVSKLYSQMDFSTEVKNWGSIQYMKKGPTGEVQTTDSKQLAPPVPERPTAANAINEGDEVNVKDGRLVVNGREIPELSGKDIKDFQVDVNELKFDQNDIDPTKPILHDNIDVAGDNKVTSLVQLGREKFGKRFDSYVYGIGQAFLELRDLTATILKYPELKKEGLGVSFDSKYRGISIRVPFSGMFINPAVPAYTEPVKAAVGMVGTMIHELAHFKVRSHNAEFPAEMQNIQIHLDELQHLMESLNDGGAAFDMWAFKKRVINLVKDHADVLSWLNETVTKGDISPRGKRFQEASAYQARNAGDAGKLEPGQDLRPSAESTGDEQGHSGVPPQTPEPTADELKAAAPAEAAKQSLYLHQLFQDPKSVGLTAPEFKKYSDSVQNANKEMIEKSIKNDILKRNAPEWKARKAEMTAQVEDQLSRAGRFAAQKYLDENKIALTPESADQLAPMFGYGSGAGMQAALKNVPDFVQTVKNEVAAQMEARYGNRMAQATQEAKELALSDKWQGVLANEVRILAKAAGADPALQHTDLVQWAKDNFEKSNIVQAADWEKNRRAVEKGGREAEKALLKGDKLEAFKAKQRQFLAAVRAKESLKLQRLIDSAEKKIDNFSSKETIPSIDQTHLEQIRQVLASVGVPQQFQASAPLESPAQFVADSNGQIAAAPWLINGRPPKLPEMTVEQFRGFTDTIKSMENAGRYAMTLENARGKAELQNVVFDIKKELDRFNFIDQPLNPSLGQRANALGRRIIGAHLLVERMFDYTDRFDPHGPITEWMDRPLRDSNSKEIALTEQVTKMLRDLKSLTDPSINELIPNSTIPDKMAKSGFAQMSRANLRQLALNMGNETNIKKVVEGFGVAEDKVWGLLNSNMTKKDWQWTQGVWDIFAHLKPEADAMQLRDTGVPVDSKVSRAISNVHGEFAGGYYPIVYDRFNSDIQGTLASKNPIFDKNYVSATTPHGYTESVTGYKGALDLTGSFLASRLQGMVHDIAFREAIRNANKLISNQEFRTALAQKWGKEFAELLPSWLKDIANSHLLDDNYAQGIARAMAIIRQNTDLNSDRV